MYGTAVDYFENQEFFEICDTFHIFIYTLYANILL